MRQLKFNRVEKIDGGVRVEFSDDMERSVDLINAAPEMLAACFSALDLIKNELGYGEVTKQLQDAIAKAKGES